MIEHSLTDWLGEFRRYAEEHPERLAVIGQARSLSWSDLERQSTWLAVQILEAGISPGDRVAVYMERSEFHAVVFLAVLKAGGCWLPIDSAYPTERIARILDCQPGAMITTPELSEMMPAPACPVIDVEPASITTADQQPRFEPASVCEQEPAYILFTSGSTGEPKQVVVSRGALARYATALGEAFSITNEDVYLHTASFAFSASIRQLIAPLTSRAALLVADEQARHDPFRLLEAMRQHGVSVWDTVPSVWTVVERVLRQRAANEPVTVPSSLRLILLTGEPLRWSQVNAWKRHLEESVEIINLYSQTETAGTVSAFRIPPGDYPTSGAVPLGNPLSGVAMLVLDEDLNEVGPGQQGELFVAGNRLGQSRQELDEATLACYLSAFDRQCDFTQVCRTGDMVRVEADGSLIPLGRKDDRVKIRGFRVDLQEVENELLRDSRVRQAIALTESPTRLLAFVVPDRHEAGLAEDLKRRLQQHLTPQSVPGRIIAVERFPLSAQGKVDRLALLKMTAKSSAPGENVKQSTNETEQVLLGIWERTLGYDNASLGDDFFDQGGDSLSAVALFLEIEEHFGVRLPPSTLLSGGTVGSLAERLQEAPTMAPDQSVLPLRKTGHLPPLFLLHVLWEQLPHFKELVNLLDPEIPVYVLEPIRSSTPAGPDLNVAQLVRQYARDIRKTVQEGPFFLGGWSIGGFMAYCVAVELESRGDKPAGLLLIDPAASALRGQMRPGRPKGMARRWAYLKTLLERQKRSLQLPLREQWVRSRWMLREAWRRMVDSISRSEAERLREQLKHGIRRSVDRYQPPPYRGSAVLFRSEQPVVDPDANDDLGWRRQITGHLEIIKMQGDHVTLVIEPQNMKLLASHISEIIKRDIDPERPGWRRAADEGGSAIDRFLEASQKLSGTEYFERIPWINQVTADSIRHFAWGIGDDNPLWTDRKHAGRRSDQPLPAPPALLVAARYPVLHGAPLDVPLISLLKDIEYHWEKRVSEHDVLTSSTRQGKVQEATDPNGNRKVHVDAHTTYRNAAEEVVGRARSTVVRMLSQGDMYIEDWSVHRYSPEELDRIIVAIESEVRTGPRLLSEAEFQPGMRLPTIVRGPLTIGDMVCWHSAVGPSYRPGPLGYKDTLKTPQFRVRNPVTGWPIKYMLHHEDVNLAHQRGMPAPFDNGIMRFAWVSPLITNWMGDEGFLAHLHVKVHLPFFYGDTCWYTGEVFRASREDDQWRVGIKVTGTNQKGSVITTGSAEVLLPVGM